MKLQFASLLRRSSENNSPVAYERELGPNCDRKACMDCLSGYIRHILQCSKDSRYFGSREIIFSKNDIICKFDLCSKTPLLDQSVQPNNPCMLCGHNSAQALARFATDE